MFTEISRPPQVSNAQARTVHVGVLESMIYIGGTLGPMLGGWIQQAWGRSGIFGACTVAINFVMIYGFYFLLWLNDYLSLSTAMVIYFYYRILPAVWIVTSLLWHLQREEKQCAGLKGCMSNCE